MDVSANFANNPTLAVAALKSANQSQQAVAQVVTDAANNVQQINAQAGQQAAPPPAGSGRGTVHDSFA